MTCVLYLPPEISRHPQGLCHCLLTRAFPRLQVRFAENMGRESLVCDSCLALCKIHILHVHGRKTGALASRSCITKMCHSGLHIEVSTLHRSQLINLTNIFLPFGQADFAWRGDGGGRGTKQNFTHGGGGTAMSHGPTPFPFTLHYIIIIYHIPFWTEKVPLLYTSY